MKFLNWFWTLLKSIFTADVEPIPHNGEIKPIGFGNESKPAYRVIDVPPISPEQLRARSWSATGNMIKYLRHISRLKIQDWVEEVHSTTFTQNMELLFQKLLLQRGEDHSLNWLLADELEAAGMQVGMDKQTKRVSIALRNGHVLTHNIRNGVTRVRKTLAASEPLPIKPFTFELG